MLIVALQYSVAWCLPLKSRKSACSRQLLVSCLSSKWSAGHKNSSPTVSAVLKISKTIYMYMGGDKCSVAERRSSVYSGLWWRPVFSGPALKSGLIPSSSDGKESACNAGDLGLIPRLERSPGEGNGYPLQYYCLESSVDGGAWQATVYGVAKSWTLQVSWLQLFEKFK